MLAQDVRLAPPLLAQREVGEMAVQDAVRVAHVAVAHEVQAGVHGWRHRAILDGSQAQPNRGYTYVNWSALPVGDVAPGVVTVTSTVPLPAGETAVICASVSTVNEALGLRQSSQPLFR